MKTIKQLAVALLLLAPMTLLAEEAPPASVAVSDHDPYQGYNRFMFNINDHLDTAIFKPVARFYNAIMPKPLNEGIHNFFNNLGNLTNIPNDLLQANFFQATNDSWRLVINTTVGIGGLFDVAERMQLKPYQNDFGLTLAKWGFRNSNYLVLPILGPSTPRDLVGIPVDYYAFSIYPYIHPRSTRYELLALWMIDIRAQLLKKQDILDEVSLDKYTFVRNAYMQNRAYKIQQNDDRGYHPADKS